ncbi:Lethal(3)malignant brain tumor-like protein 3 [Tupaia chinensis]|uniref:Lethal(3)malignant brain tumor-like protein 3 n=1 Tax=Tupaia chinensis TaxID=246437 RepID=L9L2J6_TUPCH|nr:Lethal(3)malignant brain tumor-like protein 3 [Tupaia chinensis]
MTESASSTSGQEFDVFSVMDWKDGVGTLPGSDLKFRVNEFGALEVITDENEMENVKKATATTTWMVPTAQDVFSEKTGMPFRLKDPVKVEGLQFCENCCQYGTVDECLSGGNYCSQNCARHIKDKDQKEERDLADDNEEEDSKCSRKKKPKLSLKADPKEDGEERDDEMENKQDGRILRGSQRARRKRRGDPAVLKQGLPPKGKKAWCWASYLEEEKAVAVPAKLFKEYQSFPYNKNGFKVGMKLEGVDPEHQSVYCVLTVAEVCGYRIKLHFDGYSDCYDFWVNADALDIHPVGWCEKTGHKLHPPKGYKEEEFNWQTYLKTCKAQAAPKSLFENQNIVCGYRIKLHFDGYSDCYDFWVNADALDIHPVGWCEKTGHKLHPPKGYKEEEFNWQTYLKTCKAQAAPKSLFENQNITVIPSGFRVGMKLEAVDKKNPAFICVATVTDMVDNRFLVHFDNWDESYDYWCEASSPHIHPVGWCKEHRRTLITPPGYPNVKHFSWDKYLEETNSLPAPARAFKVKPPHGFQKKMKLEVVDKRNPMFIRVATVADTDDHRIKVHFDGWNSCYDYWLDADSPDIHPVGWCSKTGHPLQPPLKINLNKDRIFPDRLSGEMPPASPSFPRNKRTDTNESSSSPEIRDQNADDVKDDFEERTESEMRTSHEARGAREEPAVQQAQRRSAVFLSFKSPIPCLPLRWEQQSKLLPTVAGIPASKVSKWSTDEQIDGEAFLLMTQTDIVKIMSIKLGPALKIFNSILMFKAAEKNSHNEL